MKCRLRTARWMVLFMLGFYVLASPQWVRAGNGECEPTNNGIEICDGIDNDCDGTVDESHNGNVIGELCGIETDTCPLPGTFICSGNALQCDANDDNGEPPGPEGPFGHPTCFDNIDNDCDGTADNDGDGDAITEPDKGCLQEQETVCNGFDDDGNGQIDETFPNLGKTCSVGQGICAQNGTVVCTADGSGTACSAAAIPPFQAENCGDGVDNDCDGATDAADTDCQSAEMCNGVDDNGDGNVDEGFSGVGNACSVGQGECRVSGNQVCSGDGSAVVCNVTPLAGSPEGPSGATCSDGVDNDCDGATDAADADCVDPQAAMVMCSLEHISGNPGKPGPSCNGRFRLHIDHNLNASDVSAEILALNPDGSLINLSPNSLPVRDGTEMNLASRLDPSDWKVDSRGRFTDVFAPVPLVVVTAHTGDRIQKAFCSIIPYMDVTRPSGDVVTVSEGDRTVVEVAIPRVDPTTLSVLVDGVDILAGLGVDPVADFPGGPYDGQVMINGQQVMVSDLIVQTSDLEEPGANSLMMLLENLGGGGHIVIVNGEECEGAHCPDALPDQTSAECHRDNIADAGIVSVFDIEILSPTANQVVPPGNTQLQAEVRHGRDIAHAAVGGMSVPVDGNKMCNTTDFTVEGETFSVGECVLEINKNVPQTNFDEPLQLGTFDLGDNDVTVSARDDLGNQAFANRRFTMGETVAPTSVLSPAAQDKLKETIDETLQDELATAIQRQTSLDIAFSFGITEGALNTFFQSTCDRALTAIRNVTEQALMNAEFDPITIPIDNLPDPTVQIHTVGVTFGDDLTCQVIAHDGFITVDVQLPAIGVTTRISGSARTEDPVFGICLASVSIDTTTTATLSGIRIEFDVSETLALSGGQADPRFIEATNLEFQIDNETGIDIGCVAGFFADVIEAITFVFTFGQAAVDFENALENTVEHALANVGDSIQTALRSAGQDPLEVDKIEVNEDDITSAGLLANQELVQVRITPAGLTGTIGASINTPVPDGTVEGEPGGVVSGVRSPVLPVPGMKDIYFATTDNLFNLLFAALTLQGNLRTDCALSGDLVVNDLLPSNCSALSTAGERGRCQGAKGIQCSSLPADERFTCGLTRDGLASRNISADTPLLFCAAENIAPRMLINDDLLTTDAVEAQVHMNDLKVSIVLDRDGNGQLTDTFPTTNNCFGLQSGDTVGDCKWAQACFDLNLGAALTLGTSNDGDPQIVRTIQSVDDFVGFQCLGGLFFGPEDNLLSQAGTSDPVGIIGNNIGSIVPLFEAEGLELGGLVNLVPNGRMLLSIDTGVEPNDDCATCDEFVGLTGTLEAAP